MKTQIVLINNCYDCPFNDKGGYDGYEPHCFFIQTDWNDVSDIPKDKRVETCPLDDMPILIKAK